ncbi:hypothetical protein HELRODRAFT_65850, partial [Helobdella robusta]|uniref:Bestrophin homolog n=1 Tax=Helobdella robusta TaxID=6412 RepID=T1FYD6_HELRO
VKILRSWNGSVYKMIWPELLIFCLIYLSLSITYHLLLNEFQKEHFETVAKYCDEFSRKLPLSFVLGFFVSTVVYRFWIQFNNIAWPADVAIKVNALISGKDEEGRMLRRTIMRYICAGYVFAFCSISAPIKKRFPTLEHFVLAGFLLPNEKIIFENIPTTINKYVIPFVWAANLVQKAKKEGRTKDQMTAHILISAINDFRGKSGMLTSLDSVTIPLAYTQVVILAVFIFCTACLMGRYKFDDGDEADYHLPLLTIFQFIFYMGWLKVALSGLHAFGDDDDDFELNSLIDMALQESYLIVDQMYDVLPEYGHDIFWNKRVEIPYTEMSIMTMKDFYIGSATTYQFLIFVLHFLKAIRV